jgi:hypothetical protein
MQLDHERLDVYEAALEFLVQANGIIEGMPRGRSHLADQFTRASLSIVLNLAEGAGKHGRLDKRRYYLTGRRRPSEPWSSGHHANGRCHASMAPFCSGCVLMSAIDRAVDTVPLVVVFLTERVEQALPACLPSGRTD